MNYTRLYSAPAYLWQLPQVLIGCCMLAIFRKVEVFSNAGLTLFKVSMENADFGVSFGPFIFVPEGASLSMCKHESGHSVQSLWLGPLYLLIVGIPSVTRFWYAHFHPCTCNDQWYCSHFPENWADKLGGVK